MLLADNWYGPHIVDAILHLLPPKKKGEGTE